MKTRNITLISMLAILLSAPALAEESANCHDLQNFSATKLRSKQSVNFCTQFSGKAMLLVNTASQCGYTPQFKGLEALHQRYGDKLAIVGFPSDDFNQEHADNEKIADVCYVNYGVTFTMLEPSQVKGDAANTVFRQLADRTGQEPSWNFNKYLVSADGSEVTHFASAVKPQSEEFTSAIEQLLGISD